MSANESLRETAEPYQIDRALLGRVVVAILTTRDGVKVEIYSQPILACPCETLEEICPPNVGQERLSWIHLDDPVWNGQADPVQTSASNLRKVALSL